MKSLITELRISIMATLFLTVILCVIYPLTIWALAHVFFPAKADGSLIIRDQRILGSSLLSQGFDGPEYFHPRPSSTAYGDRDGSSGGSNLGPISRKLFDQIRKRATEYRSENNLSPEVLIPSDAITASGSGLDPHISLRNAMLQLPRVARARGMTEEAVLREVDGVTEGRDLGVFGEVRVNVLMLNLALDGVSRQERNYGRKQSR